jgi:hypothetical protein
VITTLRNPLGPRRNRLSSIALATSVALLLLSYVGVISLFQTSVYSVLGI